LEKLIRRLNLKAGVLYVTGKVFLFFVSPFFVVLFNITYYFGAAAFNNTNIN
jgi:hypothetical protein